MCRIVVIASCLACTYHGHVAHDSRFQVDHDKDFVRAHSHISRASPGGNESRILSLLLFSLIHPYGKRARSVRLVRNGARATASMVNDDVFHVFSEAKDWIEKNGGSDSAVEAGFSSLGVGVVASHDVEKHAAILRIPAACTLSMSSINASLELAKLAESVPSDFGPAKLALALLSERAKGESSFFKPYLGLFPAAFSVPLFWSADAVKLLERYPSLHARVNSQARFVNAFAKDNLEQGHEALGGIRADAGAYAWAIAASSSRAARTASERVLIPLVDSCNHAPEELANSRIQQTKDGDFELVALRKIHRGEEITYNYGNYSNDEFVLDYGFIPEGLNKHDSVKLPWSDGRLLDIACAVANVLDELKSWQHLALSSSIPAGRQFASIKQGAIDKRTWTACRIVAAEDATTLKKASGGKKQLSRRGEARATQIAMGMVSWALSELSQVSDSRNDNNAPSRPDVDLARAILKSKQELLISTLGNLTTYFNLLKKPKTNSGGGPKAEGFR